MDFNKITLKKFAAIGALPAIFQALLKEGALHGKGGLNEDILKYVPAGAGNFAPLLHSVLYFLKKYVIFPSYVLAADAENSGRIRYFKLFYKKTPESDALEVIMKKSNMRPPRPIFIFLKSGLSVGREIESTSTRIRKW